MPIRVRFPHDSGEILVYSIEQLRTGLLYDFATSTFVAAPKAPTAPLPEDAGIFAGRYKTTLATTPATIFPDGDYLITVHDAGRIAAIEGNAVVDDFLVIMNGGDDATPGAATVATDTVSAMTTGNIPFSLGGVTGILGKTS